jgi:hypothetical protein
MEMRLSCWVTVVSKDLLKREAELVRYVKENLGIGLVICVTIVGGVDARFVLKLAIQDIRNAGHIKIPRDENN